MMHKNYQGTTVGTVFKSKLSCISLWPIILMTSYNNIIPLIINTRNHNWQWIIMEDKSVVFFLKHANVTRLNCWLIPTKWYKVWCSCVVAYLLKRKWSYLLCSQKTNFYSKLQHKCCSHDQVMWTTLTQSVALTHSLCNNTTVN